jgi:ubiquinone/menaquinone biosynthesis C-methylase UbiE
MSQDSPPICDYEGSDYQERFWEQGGRLYEDAVEAIALRRLLPVEGERLLDIGAGAGRHAPRYAGFQQIVLLDYSRSQLSQARERLGDAGRYVYAVGDAYRLPFAPATFDAAAMIRVLHHMADPVAALAQAREVLANGGAFVLEFANKHNLKALGRWLTRRQPWSPFDPRPVEFAPLNFDFHPRAVRSWLRDAGFRVRRQLSVSTFRVGTLKRIVSLNLLVAADALLHGTGNWWQWSPSVFVRAEAMAGGPARREGAFWRCPACRSVDTEEDEAGVRCQACGRLWPLRDGIYDFKSQSAG